MASPFRSTPEQEIQDYLSQVRQGQAGQDPAAQTLARSSGNPQAQRLGQKLMADRAADNQANIEDATREQEKAAKEQAAASEKAAKEQAAAVEATRKRDVRAMAAEGAKTITDVETGKRTIATHPDGAPVFESGPISPVKPIAQVGETLKDTQTGETRAVPNMGVMLGGDGATSAAGTERQTIFGQQVRDDRGNVSMIEPKLETDKKTGIQTFEQKNPTTGRMEQTAAGIDWDARQKAARIEKNAADSQAADLERNSAMQARAAFEPRWQPVKAEYLKAKSELEGLPSPLVRRGSSWVSVNERTGAETWAKPEEVEYQKKRREDAQARFDRAKAAYEPLAAQDAQIDEAHRSANEKRLRTVEERIRIESGLPDEGTEALTRILASESLDTTPEKDAAAQVHQAADTAPLPADPKEAPAPSPAPDTPATRDAFQSISGLSGATLEKRKGFTAINRNGRWIASLEESDGHPVLTLKDDAANDDDVTNIVRQTNGGIPVYLRDNPQRPKATFEAREVAQFITAAHQTGVLTLESAKKLGMDPLSIRRKVADGLMSVQVGDAVLKLYGDTLKVDDWRDPQAFQKWVASKSQQADSELNAKYGRTDLKAQGTPKQRMESAQSKTGRSRSEALGVKLDYIRDWALANAGKPGVSRSEIAKAYASQDPGISKLDPLNAGHSLVTMARDSVIGSMLGLAGGAVADLGAAELALFGNEDAAQTLKEDMRMRNRDWANWTNAAGRNAKAWGTKEGRATMNGFESAVETLRKTIDQEAGSSAPDKARIDAAEMQVRAAALALHNLNPDEDWPMTLDSFDPNKDASLGGALADYSATADPRQFELYKERLLMNNGRRQYSADLQRKLESIGAKGNGFFSAVGSGMYAGWQEAASEMVADTAMLATGGIAKGLQAGLKAAGATGKASQVARLSAAMGRGLEAIDKLGTLENTLQKPLTVMQKARNFGVHQAKAAVGEGFEEVMVEPGSDTPQLGEAFLGGFIAPLGIIPAQIAAQQMSKAATGPMSETLETRRSQKWADQFNAAMAGTPGFEAVTPDQAKVAANFVDPKQYLATTQRITAALDNLQAVEGETPAATAQKDQMRAGLNELSGNLAKQTADAVAAAQAVDSLQDPAEKAFYSGIAKVATGNVPIMTQAERSAVSGRTTREGAPFFAQVAQQDGTMREVLTDEARAEVMADMPAVGSLISTPESVAIREALNPQPTAPNEQNPQGQSGQQGTAQAAPPAPADPNAPGGTLRPGAATAPLPAGTGTAQTPAGAPAAAVAPEKAASFAASDAAIYTAAREANPSLPDIPSVVAAARAAGAPVSESMAKVADESAPNSGSSGANSGTSNQSPAAPLSPENIQQRSTFDLLDDELRYKDIVRQNVTDPNGQENAKIAQQALDRIRAEIVRRKADPAFVEPTSSPATSGTPTDSLPGGQAAPSPEGAANSPGRSVADRVKADVEARLPGIAGRIRVQNQGYPGVRTGGALANSDGTIDLIVPDIEAQLGMFSPEDVEQAVARIVEEHEVVHVVQFQAVRQLWEEKGGEGDFGAFFNAWYEKMASELDPSVFEAAGKIYGQQAWDAIPTDANKAAELVRMLVEASRPGADTGRFSELFRALQLKNSPTLIETIRKAVAMLVDMIRTGKLPKSVQAHVDQISALYDQLATATEEISDELADARKVTWDAVKEATKNNPTIKANEDLLIELDTVAWDLAEIMAGMPAGERRAFVDAAIADWLEQNAEKATQAAEDTAAAETEGKSPASQQAKAKEQRSAYKRRLREKARAILNSDDFSALSSIFAKGAITPKPHAIPLILARKKAGKKLTEKEMATIRNVSDWNGMPRKQDWPGGGNNAVIREIIDMIFAPAGKGQMPNVMADKLTQRPPIDTASEMFEQIDKELRAISRGETLIDENSPDFEGSQEAIAKLEAERAAEAAQAPRTLDSLRDEATQEFGADAGISGKIQALADNANRLTEDMEALLADAITAEIGRLRAGVPSPVRWQEMTSGWNDDLKALHKAFASHTAETLRAWVESLPVLEEQWQPMFSSPVTEAPFYSQLSRTLEAKMPKAAPPAQVVQIAASGAKAEEVKWSGLIPWLQGREKVSKDEVLEFLRNEGAVRFEEVVSGQESWTVFKDGKADSVHSTAAAAEVESIRLEREGHKSWYDATGDKKLNPKFSQYTLPGGSNYREVVLAMPPNDRFNPDKLEIRRKRSSATQGSVTLFYDGQQLGPEGYDDSGKAEDGWQRPDKEWIEYARKLYEQGDKYNKVSQKSTDYTSSHFPDVPNYVAHMRLDERTLPDGKRTMHAAEYQSDRHQAGRKKGYREDVTLPENPYKVVDLLGSYDTRWFATEAEAKDHQRKLQRLADSDRFVVRLDEQRGDIPDAPFRTTWFMALFKRHLRDAVAGGFDSVSWDTGETQNDRFDLGRQVDSINYGGSAQEGWTIQGIKNGEGIMEMDVEDVKLEDAVGKDVAQRIRDGVGSIGNGMGSLSGLDLKVGGSGMKGFYDTMLPKEIGKYVKQWGARVEVDNLLGEDNRLNFADPSMKERYKGKRTPIWRIDITPEMKKGVQSGQALFSSPADQGSLDFGATGDMGTRQQRGFDFGSVPEGPNAKFQENSQKAMDAAKTEKAKENIAARVADKEGIQNKAGFVNAGKQAAFDFGTSASFGTKSGQMGFDFEGKPAGARKQQAQESQEFTGFEDIIEQGRKDGQADGRKVGIGMTRNKTQGPGQPNSVMRRAWESGYNHTYQAAYDAALKDKQYLNKASTPYGEHEAAERQKQADALEQKQETPLTQAEAAKQITKDQAADILKESDALKDRPIRTYEQAVAANQIHMGTRIPEWSAFPFTGEMVEGRPVQDTSGITGMQHAPTLFPTGTAPGAGNCEWCGHQPIKGGFHIKHDSKKWTMIVGSECIGHFGEMSGLQMAADAREGLAMQTIQAIDDAAKNIHREFSFVRDIGYGRTERAWRTNEAKTTYDKLKAIKGAITAESGRAALSKWINARKDAATNALAEYSEIMARPETQEMKLRWREMRISTAESTLRHPRATQFQKDDATREIDSLRKQIAEIKGEATSSAESASPSSINPRDRNQFPGEDYPVPANVVFIQPRGLDTEPMTDKVFTFPYDGTAENAATVAAKAYMEIQDRLPEMSQRESIFRASGADGMTKFRLQMDQVHDRVTVFTKAGNTIDAPAAEAATSPTNSTPEPTEAQQPAAEQSATTETPIPASIEEIAAENPKFVEPIPQTGSEGFTPEQAASELAKRGITIEKDSTKTGKTVWRIMGKTFDVKDQLKAMGAKWFAPAKAWSIFSNEDPTQAIADTIAGKQPAAATEPSTAPDVNDARTDGKPDEDLRLRQLRDRLDKSADERRTRSDAVEAVNASTADLIRRGLQYGMPAEVVEDQIEDIAMITRAYEAKKPMFLLGNGAGTGKTFVLGGAIRELRADGAKNFVYVTMNTDLIAQIKRDLADFGIQDVSFHTYSELSGKSGVFLPDDAVLIFDEAHNVKNSDSSRGEKAQPMMARAKFTIFASATPFENPVEASYLAGTGVFNEAGGHTEWGKAYGANVRKYKVMTPYGLQERETLYWTGGKLEDGLAARQWFVRQGIMVTRPMRLPMHMIESQFTKRPVTAQFVEIHDRINAAYDDAMSAFRDEDGNILDARNNAMVSMHQTNTIKRVLEAAKIDHAVEEANRILDAGGNVVLFVETKADRYIGRYRASQFYDKSDRLYTYPEIREMMAEWQIMAGMARMSNEAKPPRPFAEFIVQIARAMHEAGVEYELPSVEEQIVEKLGGTSKVAIYTGSVSNAAASKDKEAFLAGKKRVIVATMAKGGTGLSLHDKVGNRETWQVNLNLPWRATGVDQVSGRVARYGLQSKAHINWLFADNIPFERMLAGRVGRRMRDMGALVKGIDMKAARVLTDEFDFQGSTDVKQREGEVSAPDVADDIWALAERLEKSRSKASDTSMGFFETPYPIAALMTEISGARGNLLEPSGGRGNLVRFVKDNPKVTSIRIIEARRDNADYLKGQYGDRVTQGDFLEEADGLGKFNTIHMNPPFERVAGIGAQDVAHVMKAFDLLEDNGRLVAIMGEGAFFRNYQQEREFRAWLDERGAIVVKLPENAFKNSGTGVRTRMVILDKNGEAGRTDIDLEDMDTDSMQSVADAIPTRDSIQMFSSAPVAMFSSPVQPDLFTAATAPDAAEKLGEVKVGRMNALAAYRTLTAKRDAGKSLSGKEEQQLLDAEQALGQKLAFDMEGVRGNAPAQETPEPTKPAAVFGQNRRDVQDEMSRAGEIDSRGQISLLSSPSENDMQPTSDLTPISREQFEQANKNVKPSGIWNPSLLSSPAAWPQNLYAYTYAKETSRGETKHVVKAINERTGMPERRVFDTYEEAKAEMERLDDLASPGDFRISLFSSPAEESGFKAIKEQFARDLTEAELGAPGHKVLQLGQASPALVLAGVPAGPVFMKRETALAKPQQEEHPYPRFLLRKIPDALRDPILVHESWTQPGAMVALLDIKHAGKSFVAALHFTTDKAGAEITEISSFYPRESAKIMEAFERTMGNQQGSITYWNKEKTRDWLANTSGSNSPQLWFQRLGSVKGIATDADLVNGQAENGTKLMASPPSSGEAIQQALEKMPPLYREVFDAVNGGASPETVAKRFNLSPKGVENILNQVRARVVIATKAEAGTLKPVMQDGKFAGGRPDLAEGAKPDFVAVDQIRNESDIPGYRAMEETRVKADAALAADYEGEFSRLETMAKNGDAPSDLDVATAKEIFRRESLSGGLDDPQRRARVALFRVSYREMGSEQSRAFSMRRDESMTPAERHALHLAELMFEPSPKVRERMQGADANTRDAILKQWMAQIDAFKAEMKADGYDIDASLAEFRRRQDAQKHAEQVHTGTKAAMDEAMMKLSPREKTVIRLIRDGSKLSVVMRQTGMGKEEILDVKHRFGNSWKEAIMEAGRRFAANSLLSSAPRDIYDAVMSDLGWQTDEDFDDTASDYLEKQEAKRKEAKKKDRKPKKDAPQGVQFTPEQQKAINEAFVRFKNADPSTWTTLFETESKNLTPLIGQVGFEEFKGKVLQPWRDRWQTEMEGIANPSARMTFEEWIAKPSTQTTAKRERELFPQPINETTGTFDATLPNREGTLFPQPINENTGTWDETRPFSGQGEFFREEINETTGTFDVNDPVAMAHLMNENARRQGTWINKLTEFYKMAILSGPQTMLVNASGGLFVAYDATAKRAVEAAWNGLLGMFGAGDARSATFGEFLPMLKNVRAAAQLAARNALSSWKLQSPVFDSYASAKPIQLDFSGVGPEYAPPATTSAISRFLRNITFRELTAVDEFWKGMFAQLDVAALSHRIAAKEEGLKGQAYTDRVAELMKPGSLAWQRTISRTQRATFQDALAYGKWTKEDERKNPAHREGTAMTWSQALKKAETESAWTFLDALAVKAQEARKAPFIGPLLHMFALPFIQTPKNMIQRGLEVTPLGAVVDLIDGMRSLRRRIYAGSITTEESRRIAGELYNKQRFVQTLTNQSIGIMLYLALESLANGGDDDEDGRPIITGTMPFTATKRGERDNAQAVMPPQSIRIGNTIIPYGRIEPFATAVSALVDIAASSRRNGGAYNAQVVTDSIVGLKEQFKDKLFLKGIGDMLRVVEDPRRGADRLAASYVTGFIPNLVRQPVRELDSKVRDKNPMADDGFFKAVATRVGYEIVPQAAPAKIDVWGDPIPSNRGELLGGSKIADSIFRVLDPTNTRFGGKVKPIDAWIYRYNLLQPDSSQRIGIESFPDEVSFTVPGENKPRKVALTPAEHEEANRNIGRAALDMLGEDWDWRTANDANATTRAESIKDVFTHLRRAETERIKIQKLAEAAPKE